MCITDATTNMTFFTLAGILVKYLQVIQSDFETAIKEREYGKFKEIINIHNEIVRCYKKLNSIYAPLIFQRYIMSGSCICVIGFNITSVIKLIRTKTFQYLHPFLNYFQSSDTPKKIYSFLLFCTVLCGIAVYTYIGDKLTKEVQ